MESIAVFTKMYRLEDSARKAIESVLNQSFTDYRYYILVNQQTKHLAQEYLNIDQRITIITAQRENENIKDHFKNITPHHEYLFVLDADDYLDYNCLELLYNYAQKERLDITFCGNTFEQNNTITNKRQLAENISLSKKDTLLNLPSLYQFLRTFWGKLWKMSLFDKLSGFPDDIPLGSYGGDTLNCFCLLDASASFGGITECLYHYTMNTASVSHIIKPGRHRSDPFLYNYVMGILTHNEGTLTKQNFIFLLMVYKAAIIDTLNLIQQANISHAQKCTMYFELLNNPSTLTLFRTENNEGFFIENKPAFLQFAGIIFEPIIKQTLCDLDISFYYPTFFTLYPQYKSQIDPKLFAFLCQNPKLFIYCITLDQKSLCDALINTLLNNTIELNSLILRYVSQNSNNNLFKTYAEKESFALNYFHLMQSLYYNDYISAINFCQKQMATYSDTDFKGEFIDIIINSAAYLENAELFLYGKQQKMEYLYSIGEMASAKIELNDLIEMGTTSEIINKYQILLT